MKTDERKEQLIESTLAQAGTAFGELFPFLPAEWLNMDLTAGQLRTLLLLYSRGPSRMTDVATALGVTMATATGVIDRMVERRIVVRQSDPDDRRIVLCRMSPEGEKMVTGLWHAWSERAGLLLRALDRPKLLAVRGMLEALLEAGENTKGQW
jgi:DNA-binding MarR family transcriptional regulator